MEPDRFTIRQPDSRKTENPQRRAPDDCSDYRRLIRLTGVCRQYPRKPGRQSLWTSCFPLCFVAYLKKSEEDYLAYRHRGNACAIYRCTLRPKDQGWV